MVALLDSDVLRFPARSDSHHGGPASRRYGRGLKSEAATKALRRVASSIEGRARARLLAEAATAAEPQLEAWEYSVCEPEGLRGSQQVAVVEPVHPLKAAYSTVVDALPAPKPNVP